MIAATTEKLIYEMSINSAGCDGVTYLASTNQLVDIENAKKLSILSAKRFCYVSMNSERSSERILDLISGCKHKLH